MEEKIRQPKRQNTSNASSYEVAANSRNTAPKAQLVSPPFQLKADGKEKITGGPEKGPEKSPLAQVFPPLPVSPVRGRYQLKRNTGNKPAGSGVNEFRPSVVHTLTVQRKALPSTGVIQRKLMTFITNAHAHKLKGANVNSSMFGSVGPKYKPGQTIDIDETAPLKTDKKGEEFYKLKTGGFYIRKASLVDTGGKTLETAFTAAAGANKTAAPFTDYARKNAAGDDYEFFSKDIEEEESGVEDFGNTLDETGGNLGDFADNVTTGDPNSQGQSSGNGMIDETTARNLGFATGTINTATGIFGMATAIHSIATGEMEEKIEAIFDLLSATASTTEGALSLAETATENENVGSAVAYAGTVADAINSIKEAVFMVKEIYSAYKDATSVEGTSGTEKFEAGMSIVSHLLESAASAVSALNTILDTITGVTDVLANAVPGFSLALNGANIALKTYSIIKANIGRVRMKKEKAALKSTIKGRYAGFFEEKTNLRGQGTGKYKTKRPELQKRIQELEKKTGRTADEEKELEALIEYDFILEMEYINKKRITRSGIKIGIELAKVAGEIATLTGYGAVGGVPLKAFAAGTDISMSVFRKIKQAGRDKAAVERDKRIAAGRAASAGSRWEKVFNADKSSENKRLQRRKDAVYIFRKIAGLNSISDPLKQSAEKERIENYILATGAHPKAMYRAFYAKTDQLEGLKEAVGVLIGAMSKRD